MKSPTTVIVVDDHPLYRSGVVQSLRDCLDISVVGEGSSADDAERLALELVPDIALVDVSMPGGGTKAAARISKLGGSTAVIMLTVSERDDDIVAALEAGARGYVLKGVGGDELAKVIRSVATGQSYITPSLAVRVLNAMRQPRDRPDGLDSLTHREEQILKLVASGLSNKEVGLKLDLQEKTVKHYMTSILQKLAVRNRVEAAVLAREAWKSRSEE